MSLCVHHVFLCAHALVKYPAILINENRILLDTT